MTEIYIKIHTIEAIFEGKMRLYREWLKTDRRRRRRKLKFDGMKFHFAEQAKSKSEQREKWWKLKIIVEGNLFMSGGKKKSTREWKVSTEIIIKL